MGLSGFGSWTDTQTTAMPVSVRPVQGPVSVSPVPFSEHPASHCPPRVGAGEAAVTLYGALGRLSAPFMDSVA